MRPQFSSNFDRAVRDLVVARARVRELTDVDRWIQPSELLWLERKIGIILEDLGDGEEPT